MHSTHETDNHTETPPTPRKISPVFETAPAGLYRSSVKGGHILGCNQRMARMLGYESVETCIAEYRFAEHYCDPQRRGELLQLLRQHGEVSDFDADLMRQDGKVISVVFNARLFEEEGYLEGVMIDVTARKLAERDLQRQQETIEAKNIALHEVLERVEEHRSRIAGTIHENIQRNIAPLIDRLAERVAPDVRPTVEQLAQELAEIVAPYTEQLAREFESLTPAELRICNMIRRGLSSKDIAAAEGITAGTVSVHREHIRRKLNLTNTKVNLTTFLQSKTHVSDS